MTPEEIEISQKQQQVDALEEKLTAIESEFANHCIDVEAFQQVYLAKMGPLYAKLDRWNLRLACTGLVIDRLRDVRDGNRPVPEDPFEWSASSIAEAREEWGRRHQRTSGHTDSVSEIKPKDDKNAKELYRTLVKKYHPDLVNDPDAQAQRTQIMIEINEAYQRQDITALEELLNRPPIVDPDDEDTGDILIRLIRKVAQLNNLIELTTKRIAKEKEGELFQLYQQCGQCETQYGDPFYVLKKAVYEQIERAKLEWMHQRSRESKLWTEVEL